MRRHFCDDLCVFLAFLRSQFLIDCIESNLAEALSSYKSSALNGAVTNSLNLRLRAYFSSGFL